MNKKKIFITTILIILAVVIAVAVIMIITSVKNTPVSGVDSNKAATSTANQVVNPDVNQTKGPAVNEVLDVKKIDTQKELNKDDLDVVKSDLYTVPKTISEIELMSNAEKTKMGIDVNLIVQVLGRLDDGRPSGLKFITSENDILLDTRK